MFQVRACFDGQCPQPASNRCIIPQGSDISCFLNQNTCRPGYYGCTWHSPACFQNSTVCTNVNSSVSEIKSMSFKIFVVFFCLEITAQLEGQRWLIFYDDPSHRRGQQEGRLSLFCHTLVRYRVIYIKNYFGKKPQLAISLLTSSDWRENITISIECVIEQFR